MKDEPERTWQLLRRGSREAGDWITVDTLAHPFGTRHPAEPYRWAELEQLVFSPSRWERRLVGSTIATMPFVDRRRGREPDVADHGLGLIGDLIGDAEPDVQKALAWALRSLTVVDQAAVAAFVTDEAETAPRDRRRPSRLGHPRHARTSCRPPAAADLAPASTASAAGRALHRPHGLPRPPRSSPAWASAATCRSHR